jgi:hypothetical protein
MTRLYQPEGTALNDNQMTRLRDAFQRQRVTSEALVARLKEERERQADFIADTRTLHMVPVNDELRENLPEIPQSERLQPVKPRVAIMAAEGHEDDDWYQKIGAFAANTLAHQQIGGQLGIPRKYYLKMLEEQPDLLAANVNTWFESQPKRRMVRTMVTNGDPDAPRMAFARGWMSDHYRRLDSLELTDTILPVLEDPSGGWQLDSCGITDLAMHIEASYPSLTDEVTVGDAVSLGVKIRTSDVGAGAISVGLGIKRLICSNLMTVPEYTERIIHRTAAQGELVEVLTERTLQMEDKVVLSKLKDLIVAMANAERFGKLVATMRDADGADLQDPVAASQLLASNLGLTGGEFHGIQAQLMSGENRPTVWGLTNALTATAREMEFERKTELESAAGKLINNPRGWRAYTEAVAA